MKYQPPYVPNWPNVPDPNAPYVNGNPPAGLKGSVPPASAFEYPQREIVNLITKGGTSPNDSDMYQLTKSARRALYAWGIDTGSANSLSVTLDPPLDSYGQGLELRVLVGHDNTGAATIRVNNLSTQQIIKKDGSSLFSGDLKQGGIAVMVYDGGRFQLTSGAAGSTTITGGWYNGADWIVDTGPVNHLQGAPPVVPVALSAGVGYSVLVGHDITGPIDINVASLGIKQIFLPNGEPLASGDIVAGMVIRIVYDGTRFTMISKIHMEIIDTTLTRIVGPNAGADFADLYKAMGWLQRRRIDQNGLVTFTLQGQTTGTPLVHTYPTHLIVEHPDGDRLTIQGLGMNAIPSTFTDGRYGTPAATAAASNVAYLRTCFQTELRFAAAQRIDVRGTLGVAWTSLLTPSRSGLKNLLVTGAAMSSSGCGGILVNGSLSVDTVAVAYSASTTWYVGPNASLFSNNLYGVGATQFNMGISHSGNVIGYGGKFFLCQSGSDGIQAAHGAIIQINIGAQIYQCSGWGVNHWGASSLHMNNALITNSTGGILTTSASSWVYGTNVSTCGSGFAVAIGGQMDCNTTFTAEISAGYDYQATNGAFMYAASYQNGSAQFSPARQTVGNGNAYINA